VGVGAGATRAARRETPRLAENNKLIHIHLNHKKERVSHVGGSSVTIK
jgi:hypothetical protein